MDLNDFSPPKERKEEVEYLHCENLWAFCYSTCSPRDWGIGHKTNFMLKRSKLHVNDVNETMKTKMKYKNG